MKKESQIQAYKNPEFGKLVETADVDWEKVRQLASLMEEESALTERLSYLSSIKRNHKNLQKFMWRTKTGRYMAIHDMDDDHVKNSTRFSLEKLGYVPPVLLAEYYKRFGETLPEVRDDGSGSVVSEDLEELF